MPDICTRAIFFSFRVCSGNRLSFLQMVNLRGNYGTSRLVQPATKENRYLPVLIFIKLGALGAIRTHNRCLRSATATLAHLTDLRRGCMSSASTALPSQYRLQRV